MQYKRKNITLPESVSSRLEQEHNASGTITEALKLYWEHKDLVKQVISKNRYIISLLEDSKTTNVRYAEIENTDQLAECRRNYPHLTFRQTTNGVEVFHKSQKQWLSIDDVEFE